MKKKVVDLDTGQTPIHFFVTPGLKKPGWGKDVTGKSFIWGSVSLPNIICSILLVALLLAVMAGCMMLSILLMKRGMLSVVQVFRVHNAVGESNAKTFLELGLRPKTLVDYFTPGLRDYKKEALRLMMANGIVCRTVDNRVYLIENCPF